MKWFKVIPSRVCFLIVSLITSWSFVSIAEVPNLINKTVAKSGNQIITERQVLISNIINTVLQKISSRTNKESSALADDLKNQNLNLDKTLELAYELAIENEATHFQIARIEKNEIKELVHEVNKELQKNKDWYELGGLPTELEVHLERKLKVRKFLKFKISSLVSLVSEQDIKAYYDKNTQKFAQVNFEKIKENIRAFLIKEKNDEQLKSWFGLIQKKYNIQTF